MISTPDACTLPITEQSSTVFWKQLTMIGQHLDTPSNQQLITSAFCLAVKAHAQQTRASGQPYVIHPIAVALTVAEIGMDAESVAAALLHDVLEDTETSYSEIVETTNEAVAAIVEGVTKLDKVAFSARNHTSVAPELEGSSRLAGTLQKMLVAATSDVRVLVVKLADRLHNVSTLEFLSVAKQKRVAEETLDVYAPLAHRLGMDTVRSQLEDYAFAAAQPDLYEKIRSSMEDASPDRDQVLALVRAKLAKAFEQDTMEVDVVGRTKSVYSVYRKMVARQTDFSTIADLVGVRVITSDIDCVYRGLGVVHRVFTPVPGKVRDYIASPKFNAYQSLHTVVMVNSSPVEVQLRTWQMHAAAELGVAAHWRYRYDLDPSDIKSEDTLPVVSSQLPWLTRLATSGQAVLDPQAYLEALRADLAAGEVTALTPSGQAVSLPASSTCLDFAFAIQPATALHAIGARQDGQLSSLGDLVRPGSVVEIFIDENAQLPPSRLGQVHSPAARELLRSKLGIPVDVSSSTERLKRLVVSPDLPASWWKLIEPSVLAAALNIKDTDIASAIEKNEVSLEEVTVFVSRFLDTATVPGLEVDGLGTLPIICAPCCEPSPGSVITAVTLGPAVVIHKSDCPRVAAAATLVDVFWPDLAPVTARLRITALDRPGLLAEVADIVSHSGLNVHDHSGHTGTDRVAHLMFELDVAGHAQLGQLASHVAGVPGVYSVDSLDIGIEITNPTE